MFPVITGIGGVVCGAVGPEVTTPTGLFPATPPGLFPGWTVVRGCEVVGSEVK